MEIKYCTYKKQIIEIEPKNEYVFNGKKQVLKKVGHDWETCYLKRVFLPWIQFPPSAPRKVRYRKDSRCLTLIHLS